MSVDKVTRADVRIHGWKNGGLMLICIRCATTFRSHGYKVSAADDAADAHIEAHADPRLFLGERVWLQVRDGRERS